MALTRLSNVPTVWSNVVAAAWLSGPDWSVGSLVLVLIGMTLFYSAGMVLNDAFDRDVDARRRPDRPIPAGLVRARDAFGLGFLGLALGALLLAAASGGQVKTVGAILLLASLIVAYDAFHHHDALSPVLMGLCRMLVYLVTALALTNHVAPAVAAGSLLLFVYVAALSAAAKWSLCGSRGIAGLIAGMALIDAGLLAGSGYPAAACVAALAFPATMVLQRWVQGT
ncbi:UbiA family prenyltransferase [Candidatus Nitrospira bockiana]